MSKIFNIYCDESSVEGDSKHSYMVIGAFFIPRDKKREFLNNYLKISGKTQFRELKWSKISQANLSTIKKIIDLFFNTDYANYSCIVVNKKKVDLKSYHQNDKELAFYKFYYLLLKAKMHSGCKYYIYLDKKPVSLQNRVGVLKYFLSGFIKSERQDCIIKHLQEYSSTENKLIQISDLLTGAVASRFNFPERNKSLYKKEVIKYIETKLNRSLLVKTGYFESKFNVFIWRPYK